ncbi:Hypothetical Protein FCC1311_083452 [Hondaea fermentalgiana]|uniref:Uncharacterized protein n=1 Tax=Hondaea fermentalgiana TaxID=2315210 RepID=A0A2R5GML3_9STRA|nr:Hypothetical Protein FCC1311_083452 [Hondaea fermentalgiana]|eukprot:GBG32120.1 Hypothetical Protein FCC1311_083452 [Hondaea fermentalgiana]
MATGFDARAGAATAIAQRLGSRQDAVLAPVMALSAAVVADPRPLQFGGLPMPSEELLGDQQPMFGHLMPTGLGLIVAKVSIMSLCGRLRTVQKRLEEMEDEDEEAVMNIEVADVLAPSRHKHEVSVWKGFGRNLRVGVLRDVAIVTTQRIYERLAMEFFVDKKMSKSLVKNVPRSALRKWDRFADQSVLLYMQKVGACALKAQVMFWLALFTVNQAIDTYYTYQEAQHARKKGADVNAAATAVGLHRNETFVNRLILNALRCSGACVLAAVGAAIGSAIKPGTGTTLGMNIAPQFVYVFI